MHTIYFRTSKSQGVINSFRKAQVASDHCKVYITSKRTTESLGASKSWKRPNRLSTAEKTVVWPKVVSNWQGNPTCIQCLEQPMGLPCSFKVQIGLSMHACTWWKALKWCDSYEKHTMNLKECHMGAPAKVQSTPNHVRTMEACMRLCTNMKP